MRVLDRHLLIEIAKFAVIALASVVVIYLLVDLFEELNYFTSRRTGLLTVLYYYVLVTPSAVTLLYPVSLVLAVFVVYGQLTRHRELHALESAGISVYRLFLPAAAVGLLTVPLYLFGNEYVAIPANARLSDLRKYTIEKRAVPRVQTRRNLYFVGEQGRVFFVRECESGGTLKGFSITELGPDRKVARRIDGREARYEDSTWVAYDAAVRRFRDDGTEELTRHATLALADIPEKPTDFFRTPRPVDETGTGVLRRSIARLRRAGEDVSEEEVEYHYRFSYSLIGLVVMLLGLPLSVRLRKGGVMFGLGLGLLVSFLYWGAIQMSRAYGTSHVISPALSAWLPNIVFGAVAFLLLANVKR